MRLGWFKVVSKVRVRGEERGRGSFGEFFVVFWYRKCGLLCRFSFKF